MSRFIVVGTRNAGRLSNVLRGLGHKVVANKRLGEKAPGAAVEAINAAVCSTVTTVFQL
jgi:hypothetical protein